MDIYLQIREDSDYDDDYLINVDHTTEQIKTAEELIIEVEKYLNESK